jgi:hypothetical protein
MLESSHILLSNLLKKAMTLLVMIIQDLDLVKGQEVLSTMPNTSYQKVLISSTS